MPLVTTTTSSSRPALNTSDRGTILFETDKNRLIVWSGSEWVVFNADSKIDPLFLNSRSAFVYYNRSASSENDAATLKMTPGSPLFAADAKEFSISMWFCTHLQVDPASTSTAGTGAIMAGGHSGGATRAYMGIQGRDRFKVKITDAQGSYFTRQYIHGNSDHPNGYGDMNAGEFQAPTILNDGNWHHVMIAGKYLEQDDEIPGLFAQNRVFRVWIDGQACSLYNNTGVYQGVDYKGTAGGHNVQNVWFRTNYTTYPLEFGTYGSGTGADGFAGWIDEVAMYDKFLTSDNVTAIHAAGAIADLKKEMPNYTPDNLVHYYRMGDDDGQLRANKETIETTLDSVVFNESNAYGGNNLTGFKKASSYTHFNSHVTPVLVDGPIFTNFAVDSNGNVSVPFPDAKVEYQNL